MMREDGLHTWGRLRCATKKGRCPPASQCAITDENGQRTVITRQIPFQNAVTEALDRRYHGASDAPINSGQLHQDLGYLADTESAQALLRGDYKFPEDSDEATLCTFRELVPLFNKQHCPMNIVLKNSDFRWWRTADEKIESSRSTVGFSHMIAQSHSEKLTTIQVRKLNLIVRNGFPLDRWLNGILLLLQKEIGNIDIEKLRFIILLKVISIGS